MADGSNFKKINLIKLTKFMGKIGRLLLNLYLLENQNKLEVTHRRCSKSVNLNKKINKSIKLLKLIDKNKLKIIFKTNHHKKLLIIFKIKNKNKIKIKKLNKNILKKNKNRKKCKKNNTNNIGVFNILSFLVNS